MYETLSDKEKREVYDNTGVVLGEDGDDLFARGMNAEDLYQFYREVFAKVSEEDIDAYEVQIFFCFLLGTERSFSITQA